MSSVFYCMHSAGMSIPVDGGSSRLKVVVSREHVIHDIYTSLADFYYLHVNCKFNCSCQSRSFPRAIPIARSILTRNMMAANPLCNALKNLTLTLRVDTSLTPTLITESHREVIEIDQ